MYPFQDRLSLVPKPKINNYSFEFGPAQPLKRGGNLGTLLREQRKSLHRVG